jgi:hypothetical protein
MVRELENMIEARLAPLVCGALTALALSACGGGGGGTATVGGTVTGLGVGRTLVLQNNLTDTFTIAGNGANSFTFTFATGVGAGGLYSATVLTQPLGETCVVTKGVGSIDNNADNVTTIAVDCAVTSSVAGTVTGLGAGRSVTLANNGVAAPAVAANGSFNFPGILTTGSTYAVTITQQPALQTCTLSNATGTVVVNTTAVVGVTCQ